MDEGRDAAAVEQVVRGGDPPVDCGADDESIAGSLAGDMPGGWEVETLRGLSRGDGRYGSPEAGNPYDPRAPRYIRITDINDDGTLRPDSRASVPAAKAEPYMLAPGDLLLARSGATVGKSYLYDPAEGPCAFAGYLICFALDPRRCVPGFVARYVQSTPYWSWVKRTARQGAQPNINAAEFGDLCLPVPPLDEQRRISALLDLVEQVIHTSARVVDKLTAMKTALLHELLRFGVDRRGRMQRDRRLCESPIGPVPADWTVAPMQDLLADVNPAMRSGPFGSDLKKSDLVEDGIPLLGIDNVDVDAFVPRYKRFVSRVRYHRFKRYLVRPGDVMITIMGTVGRACVAPKNIGRALSSKHVWVLTLEPSRYVPELASLQLNHARWVRDHFRRDEQGGTMAAIRSDTLRTTLLPVPPMAEQRRIAEIMRIQERRLADEKAMLAKHKAIRKALMDALFTGKLRAPALGLIDD